MCAIFLRSLKRWLDFKPTDPQSTFIIIYRVFTLLLFFVLLQITLWHRFTCTISISASLLHAGKSFKHMKNMLYLLACTHAHMHPFTVQSMTHTHTHTYTHIYTYSLTLILPTVELLSYMHTNVHSHARQLTEARNYSQHECRCPQHPLSKATCWKYLFFQEFGHCPRFRTGAHYSGWGGRHERMRRHFFSE